MSLLFGKSKEYSDLFIHMFSAVGMTRVCRKWFMSQKYWYRRAQAQGSEKEKQETAKLYSRLSENMCQRKKKKKEKHSKKEPFRLDSLLVQTDVVLL